MTQIIAKNTASSVTANGLFYNGQNFVNAYGEKVDNTWAVNCYWTNQNSKFGCDVADVRTAKFCADYNIENKMY